MWKDNEDNEDNDAKGGNTKQAIVIMIGGSSRTLRLCKNYHLAPFPFRKISRAPYKSRIPTDPSALLLYEADA